MSRHSRRSHRVVSLLPFVVAGSLAACNDATTAPRAPHAVSLEGPRNAVQAITVHIAPAEQYAPLDGRNSGGVRLVAPSGEWMLGSSFNMDAPGALDTRPTVWSSTGVPTTLAGFGFHAAPTTAGVDGVNAYGQAAGLENVNDVFRAILWTPNTPGALTVGTSVDVSPAPLPPANPGSWMNTSADVITATGTVGGGLWVDGAEWLQQPWRCFAWVPTAPNATTGTATILAPPDAAGEDCHLHTVARGSWILGSTSPAYADRPSDGRMRAFRWKPAAGGVGTFERLFTSDLHNRPSSANAAGQVAGARQVAAGAPWEGYVWTPESPDASTGQMQSLGVNAHGAVLNDAGYVLFFRMRADGLADAFLRIDGVDHPLPVPAGMVQPQGASMSEPVVVSPTTTQVIIGGSAASLNPTRYRPLRWVVTIERPTQQGTIGGAVGAVNDLLTGGALPAATANTLLGKLEAAQRQLDRGQVKAARNLLTALLNEIDALVASGRLTAAQAQPLLAAVQAAIAAI